MMMDFKKEIDMKAKDKILRKIKNKMDRLNFEHGLYKKEFDINDPYVVQMLMEYFGIDVGEYNKTIHEIMDINFAKETKENNESKFLELVNEKKSQLSEMPAFSIMDYFRREYDGMIKLIELVNRSKSSQGVFENRAYEEISEQAFLDGIKRKDGSKLSASNVGTYLSRVKKERESKENNNE